MEKKREISGNTFLFWETPSRIKKKTLEQLRFVSNLGIQN
jgi:hypothetical protein